MTLKNNRAPLLSNIKPYASFHHHMWIQTGVTVRKRLSWVVTSVPLTFDLWPWPFAGTLLWSLVITPENFMMIRWWAHSQKGVTDRQTENTICRAAWSQLKTLSLMTLKINDLRLQPHLPGANEVTYWSWDNMADILKFILLSGNWHIFHPQNPINSLAPGRIEWNFKYLIILAHFTDWWLRYLLWNCFQVNVTGPYWW